MADLSKFRCEAEWLGGSSSLVTVEGELDLLTAVRLRDLVDGLERCGISDRMILDADAKMFPHPSR